MDNNARDQVISNDVLAQLCELLVKTQQLGSHQPSGNASAKSEVTKNSEDFLTSDEVCEYLQITKACLYEKVRNGDFPVYKPSPKILLVKKQDLLSWIEAGKVSSQSELEERAHQISLSNSLNRAV